MSTQSGIQPTEELLDAFKSFVAGNKSILTATIVNERVELSEIINESNAEESVKTLRGKVSESTPLYIIFKNESGKNSFTFVAFVPDYAAVKDKMLYASSKNNLIRNFGSEYFTNVLFWNNVDEVDYKGWIHTITSDSSKTALSNEEKELEKLKDLELDTLTQFSSTKQKLVSHANEFSFKFHENVEDLTLTDNDLHSFNIELPDEEVFLSNSVKISTPKDIVSAISPDYPQFNVLRYNKKNYFIYSCPSGSKVKERMIYASNKQGVTNHFKTKFNSIDKSIEIGDPDELELTEFEESDPSAEKKTNLAFSRPSRPGRRR